MYDNLSENELAVKALNDRDALLLILEKYAPLVKSCASTFSGGGAEYEDLLQEGMIALTIAVKSYNKNLSSFPTFAKLCVMRAVSNALRSELKKGNIPENMQVQLDDNLLSDDTTDPEFLLSVREEYFETLRMLKETLSVFEYNVLLAKLSGYQNNEIARKLSVEKKAVENAVNRIHSKIK